MTKNNNSIMPVGANGSVGREITKRFGAYLAIASYLLGIFSPLNTLGVCTFIVRIRGET